MSVKIKRTVYSLLIVLVFAIFIMPFVIGIWIKYEYDALIAFYNSQAGIHIEVKKYERHWFSADVVLAVILNPDWVMRLSQTLQDQGVAFPASIDFTVQQRIQNGPILYRKSKDNTLALQLAYMYSEIQFSPELTKIVELVNPYQQSIVIVDNLNFNGKFHRIFRSAGFRMRLADDSNKLELRGINADISVWPSSRRIKANIKTDDFIAILSNFEAVIPQIKIQCDRKESPHKLWVGTSAVQLPQILLRDSEQAALSIVNATTTGELWETGEMLNGIRNVGIDKLEAAGQTIGPIKLRISTYNFDATQSEKIISTYGQMLFSDQYMLAAAQLLTSLPEIINGQSSINIEELTVATPNGHLQVAGKIDWPGLAGGSLLSEVVQHTRATATLRIAVPLAQRLAQAILNLKYVNEPIAPTTTVQAQPKLAIAEHQNELVIAMFVESHQLTKDQATNLLAQQKQKVSLDDYQHLLDSMVAANQMSQMVADTLHAKYEAIQWVIMPADQRKENAQKMLQDHIKNWLRQGFINKDKDDFVATFSFVSGHLLINNKPIEQAY